MNRVGAKYIVVGGFAIIEAGFPRLTGDIDFLIDPDPENERRVFSALEILHDQAVKELEEGDVSRFTVVRVADEVVVDLMATACGVSFQEAIRDAVFRDVDGVRTPFASPEILLRMKQTVREKDIADRMFLEKLLSASRAPRETESPGLWTRVLRWFGKS